MFHDDPTFEEFCEILRQQRAADYQQAQEDVERYAYPPPLHTCGFFEDFFDAHPETVATFWQVVNQRLATAMGHVS